MPGCGVDMTVGIDGEITDRCDERRFTGLQFVCKSSRSQRLQLREILVERGRVNVDQSKGSCDSTVDEPLTLGLSHAVRSNCQTTEDDNDAQSRECNPDQGSEYTALPPDRIQHLTSQRFVGVSNCCHGSPSPEPESAGANSVC